MSKNLKAFYGVGRGALVGALFAVTSMPAVAQESSDAAEAARVDKDEIIVTAEKRSISLSRVPAAVVAVGGDKLAESGISDIRSLDSVIAGVKFSGNGSLLSPSVRGIGSTQYSPLGGPAVGLNVDGVPIDGMIGATGLFYDVQRVEVLKGPQGTLYGRNATAGVMNVVTNKPVIGETSLTAGGEIGNYSSVRLEGALNLGLSDQAALRLAAVHVGRDGYSSGGYNDASDYAMRGQLLLKPSDSLSVRIGMDYVHQGGTGPADIPLDAGFATDWDNPHRQSYYPNPTDASQDNRQWGIHAELSYDMGFATLVAIPSYRDMTRRGISYQGGFRTTNDDTDKQTSVEVRLASNDIGRVQWLIGGYYFDGERNWNMDYLNPSNCDGTPLYVFADGGCTFRNGQRSILGQRSAAAFGQVTFEVTGRFRITGGLRYTNDERSVSPNTDYTILGIDPIFGPSPVVPMSPLDAPAIPLDLTQFNEPGLFYATYDLTAAKTFENVSFKAGLEYDVAEETLLYANVSTGYKAGGINDGNVTATFYEPEKLTAYEVGVRSRLFDNTLRLHANAFYWDYKDHQEGGIYPTPDGIFYLITSIPNGKIYGLDIEADWRPTDSDTFGVQLAYLHSDTGEFSFPPAFVTEPAHAFINSPQWTLNLNYSHTFDLGSFTLEPSIQTHIVSDYNVDFRFDPETAEDGYHKSDLTLTLRPKDGNWYVGAYVRNIEDKVVRASAYAGPDHRYWGFITDPRTYGVRFGGTF